MQLVLNYLGCQSLQNVRDLDVRYVKGYIHGILIVCLTLIPCTLHI